MSKDHLPYSLGFATQPVSRSPAIGTRSFYVAAKRPFDVIVTLALAPLALAIVGILALLVRMDGEKAFFSQPRIGKGGRIFHLWKLRTMVPNANERLEQHLAQNGAARREWERSQKLKNDPRITPIGRYLRKYSLDELPQLWNVLRGDMSLVGPRPMLPEQRSLYPGTAYFQLRPGLTGLWQVSVRNGSSFAERAVHDTQYFSTMSFGTDLRILSRTPLVVFQGTGF